MKRAEDGTWRVLLIKQRNGAFWGFPKGHSAGDDESGRTTAERELLEETGYCVVRYLCDDFFVERYTFEREGSSVDKSVTYFVAEVAGELVIQSEEVLDAVWLTLEAAVDQLTYAETRFFFLRIIEMAAIF